MVPFSHILTTTYSHHNKLFLCTAGHIINYMTGRAPDSLRALDLSSFLLNGYKVFFSRGKTSEHEAVCSPLPPPTPKAEVKPSWHVDKASLHTDIQLLFQNLSMEIGLQTSHKLVCTSQQKATHTHTHTQTYTHTPTHSHTHTHTHKHTHTLKSTHTQTQALTQMCEQYVATAHTMESKTNPKLI